MVDRTRSHTALDRLGRVALIVALATPLVSCDFFSNIFRGKDVNDVSVPATFTLTVPIEAPTQQEIDDAPLDNGVRRVQRLELTLLDLVDLVPELAEYEGSVKSVRIDVITHTITRNTIGTAILPIDIRIGTNEQEIEEMTTLAQTELYPANSITAQRAFITETGRAVASLQLTTLEAGLGMIFTFNVPDGQTVSGSADTTMDFEVTVIAND